MKPSPDTSPDAVRARRLALLAAAPLAVVAFAVYALSGPHSDAVAGAQPVLAKAARPDATPTAQTTTTTQAPPLAPASVDDAPVPSPQDAELLAYHSYGG